MGSAITSKSDVSARRIKATRLKRRVTVRTRLMIAAYNEEVHGMHPALVRSRSCKSMARVYIKDMHEHVRSVCSFARSLARSLARSIVMYVME